MWQNHAEHLLKNIFFKTPKCFNQRTGHCESTNEQPDVSPPDHDALAPVSAFANAGVLVLPCGPDPHEQNQEVEDHDSHETLGVDGHLPLVRFLPPRSSATARRGLEFHGENFEEKKVETRFCGLRVTWIWNEYLTAWLFFPCLLSAQTQRVIPIHYHRFHAH